MGRVSKCGGNKMISWKDIWQKKGEKTTADLVWLDGFENTSINPMDVAEKIIKILDIKPTDKVLEIGCGAGMLAQHISEKCFYVGLDMTESLLKKHATSLGHYVIQSEANDIPFKDDYFDKCFSFSVFQYFPDKEYVKSVKQEMFRVTKLTREISIFIGDLPMKSHDKNHLLFYPSEFKKWEYYEGFYTKERFNVVV